VQDHPPEPTQRAHWHAHLSQAWLRRGWLARALWPISLLYGALARIRFLAYRRGWLASTHLPVPVIVVGNVVVGGAGKTPTVIAVVQHLMRQGHRPGVVSRGHGRTSPRAGEPLPDVLTVLPDTPAQASGDEPALIQQATGVPVFVGRSRADTGRALLAAHPDTTVLVCDDGLQHMALHADVAVAVFDERGVGNGWLLPAGLLREPWPQSVGRRVDMVLHAQALQAGSNRLPTPDAMPSFAALKQLAAHATALDGSEVPLDALPRQGLTALAGIAKPQAFFDMLSAAGVNINLRLPLADHQDFDDWINSDEFNFIIHQGIVCTEKDAVKLFPLLRSASNPSDPMLAWSVPLVFTPEPAFFDTLDEKLSSAHGHQTA
jgi:tetraacyldisaccharide 4'-kinase